MPNESKKNFDAFHIQISRKIIARIWQFPCVQPTSEVQCVPKKVLPFEVKR